MATDLETIRNIGPAMAKSLRDAGVPDAETLRDIGAHEAYRKLLQSGTRPHFIPYYVLHMGLQGRRGTIAKAQKKMLCAGNSMGC